MVPPLTSATASGDTRNCSERTRRSWKRRAAPQDRAWLLHRQHHCRNDFKAPRRRDPGYLDVQKRFQRIPKIPADLENFTLLSPALGSSTTSLGCFSFH